MDEEEETTKQPKFAKLKHIYEKDYKKLLIIPLIILIVSISILCLWKVNTGEFVEKDFSLKGGTLVTVKTDQSLDISSPIFLISLPVSITICLIPPASFT